MCGARISLKSNTMRLEGPPCPAGEVGFFGLPKTTRCSMRRSLSDGSAANQRAVGIPSSALFFRGPDQGPEHTAEDHAVQRI